MKRVALYGGSFDPPHLGHVITITAVLNAKVVDEIWLVPTGLHRDKAHQASPDDRKAMIAIMLATMFGSRVPVHFDAMQISRPWQTSTTAELVGEMERRHPGCAFSFIVGSDLIRDIPNWHSAKTLMSRKGFFLVVPRLGDELPASLPSYLTLIPTKDIALTNISSSLVRQTIAEGRSLEGIVPPAVISHIIRNQLYRSPDAPANREQPAVVYEGRFVRFLIKNGWEYVERANCSGAVLIIAMTNDGALLLTEQFRIPVGRPVIEFPAGLVGDPDSPEGEDRDAAALRELLEETGYEASKVTLLAAGPTSAGLSAEVITLVQAVGVRKRTAGGGEGSEAITVHEVPIGQVESWLHEAERQGKLVDPKIYAGLYFLQSQQALLRKARASQV